MNPVRDCARDRQVGRLSAPVAALLLLLVGTLAAAGLAFAQRPGSVSPTAAQFVVKAAEGGLAEVQMARLAQDWAGSPAVRDYATRMLTDHGQANAQLEALARAKGIALPKRPGDGHLLMIQSLATQRGPEFDVAYVEAMKQVHEQDLSLFEAAAARTFPDPELRGFALKMLPILRQHLEMIDSLQVNRTQAARRAPATTGRG